MSALPLFGDAYLADTQHLTLEEHGAYLKLLMIAWRVPNCALPDDDRRIATMLGIGAKKWATIRPAVMAFWSLSELGWRQKRLMKERRWVDEKSAKARSAASLRHAQEGAKPFPAGSFREEDNSNSKGVPRRVKSLKNNGSARANAYANGYANGYAPPPPPIKKKDRANALSNLDARGTAFDDFWSAYPRRTAKEAARKAWAAAIKRGASPEHIAGAAARYAAHPPDDPKFIPHPATWLNGGRYDDEIQETRNERMAGNNGASPRQYREQPGWDGLQRLATEVERGGWG